MLVLHLGGDSLHCLVFICDCLVIDALVQLLLLLLQLLLALQQLLLVLLPENLLARLLDGLKDLCLRHDLFLNILHGRLCIDVDQIA